MDEDENGIKDIGERYLNEGYIRIDSTYNLYPLGRGELVVNLIDDLDHHARFFHADHWRITTGTDQYDLNYNNSDNSFEIGLAPAFVLDSLDYFMTTTHAICDRESNMYVHLINRGNIRKKESICFEFPGEYIFSTFGVNPDSDNLICKESFNESLWPGDKKTYQLVAKMPDFNSLGDLLHYRLYPYANLLDTLAEYQQILLCSYDPNDKQADPLGRTAEQHILPNTDLEYLIRFQNTGNFPARDVVVIDTLDTETLDLSTFQFLSASHPISAVKLDSNVVSFQFYEINLPDSLNNEPESHGHIAFRIAQVPDLVDATLINNTAEIYFDSNPAVVTNTVQRKVMRPTTVSTSDVNKKEIIIYPNPSEGIFNIESEEIIQRVAIYNSLGQKVFTQKINRKFYHGKLATNGVYEVMIETAARRFVKKLVIAN